MVIQLEQYSAGHYEKGYEYRYFLPSKINYEWVWQTSHINSLLEKAAVKLGELNSFARLVPNIDLFIQSHVTKEAVVSSRIEGTQTNMREAILQEADVSPEHRNDWREVQNYIAALNQAIGELESLPLSSRLLKKTHAILLDSVRGKHKLLGEFRTSQNWIGGNSLADATFIPPHHQYVNDLMGDLENFLHNHDIHVPALIRIAIAHYQFETIHPFLDGNGRIGRLLITLFLVSEGVLEKPLLYLSSYFEKNKSLYYDNLMLVREKNNMLQWFKYFLVGIEQTATLAVNTLSNILGLKAEIEQSLRTKLGRRSANAQILLNALFKHPVTDVEQAQKVCNLSYKAANDLIADMCKHGILIEITGQSRNRMFMFSSYIETFNE
ncbi:MAG TPA: Fic family protein [Nitrosomonas sp.]|nr:Fic family protein [Nitrosomonas sp.]HMW21352.1 Fic family protein [Nitrosomonas sp.]HMY60677.1 Fic family protein [Nitrosomonas sp.]HMY90566.1 Fic family protein [Nitrosomonas sp.]HNA70668.1 Fic family protein [Nitrosomonas sp.]